MSDKSSGTSTLTLPSDREIVMERALQCAARTRVQGVYRSESDPQVVGTRKYTTTVDKMDVRVGGVWRFVQRDDDG